MNNYYLLTFENTHGAINAESILKENNIQNTIMPTPTYITKSCGISIKINLDCAEDIFKLINAGKLKLKSLYEINSNGYKTIVL